MAPTYSTPQVTTIGTTVAKGQTTLGPAVLPAADFRVCSSCGCLVHVDSTSVHTTFHSRLALLNISLG